MCSSVLVGEACPPLWSPPDKAHKCRMGLGGQAGALWLFVLAQLEASFRIHGPSVLQKETQVSSTNN